MARSIYNEQKLLELGRDAIAELGGEMTCHEFSHHSGVSLSTIFRWFHSWREFRRRLGLPENPRCRVKHSIYSRKELLHQLRDFAEKHGPHFTQRQFLQATGISASTFVRYLGLWPEALARVGLTAIKQQPRLYSDEWLMRDLHQVVLFVRGLPSCTEYARLGKASSQTLLQRFGNTWSEVLDYYRRWRRAHLNNEAATPRRLDPARDASS